MLINDKLVNLPDEYMVANVPFNFYTTSDMLQRVLEKPLEKKAGNTQLATKTVGLGVDDMATMNCTDRFQS